MTTPRVGVVGHPISHSLSPAIHNAALEHDGEEEVYVAIDAEPDGFAGVVERLRSEGARGINVTLPHKTAAFEIATVRSRDADSTQAVNTLLFDDEIAGHNTDVGGLRRALEELGVQQGVRTLVLGAGGAGRAAVRALDGLARSVTVANRTASRAVATGAQTVDWADREAAAARSDLVINATSLGLGDTPAPFLPAEGPRWLLDLVYGPRETELVRLARQVGIAAADGLVMLVHQAAEAYRLFWDREPPIEVMMDAAESAARRSD